MLKTKEISSVILGVFFVFVFVFLPMLVGSMEISFYKDLF